MSVHETDNFFEFLIGPHGGRNDPDDALERWSAILDAEEAFEGIVSHVGRTTFHEGDDMKVRLALSAILGSWKCVLRAREAE